MLAWLRSLFGSRPVPPLALVAAPPGAQTVAESPARTPSGTPPAGIAIGRAPSKLSMAPTLTEVLSEQVSQLGGPLVELDRDAWIGLAERIVELGDSVAPPSFPRIASQVVAVARQPDVNINELVGLVQRDAAIAATLLAVANSVAFSPATPITSLRGAIHMMGVQLVVEVALGASARSYYEVASRAELALFPNLWQCMFEEAMANAFTCGRVALDVPQGRPDRALVAGLLTDVGRPIALRILARLVHEGTPVPSEPVLLATLDEVAARIGERALRRMELPEDLLLGCIPTGDAPTVDAMIAKLVGAIAAMERRSPRIWGNAGDVRQAAEYLKLSPFLVRAMFAQRQQYVVQAREMFGTMRR